MNKQKRAIIEQTISTNVTTVTTKRNTATVEKKNDDSDIAIRSLWERQAPIINHSRKLFGSVYFLFFF